MALELIPTMQFGGHMHSSCLDAGLTLLHDIQHAHSVGLKCSILLFDVKDFFNCINHNRLVTVLQNLGFSLEVVGWTREFLQNCKVHLCFNGIISEECN